MKKYKCPECGETENIQLAVWVDANTGEWSDGDPPIDRNAYCDECEYTGRAEDMYSGDDLEDY